VTKHTPTRARRKNRQRQRVQGSRREGEGNEGGEREASANRYRLRGSRENVARPNRKATPTQEGLTIAAEHLVVLERLAIQAADRGCGAEQVRLAQEEVYRIRKISFGCGERGAKG